MIIVSGGSSVGIEDLAPTILAQHGDLAIHGIAMRPSSPTGLGRIGHRLVFLLPGNPVSCLCAYDFFAGRAIRALGGRTKAWPYRSIRGQAGAQDQLADRAARLRARASGRRSGRAARRRRRVGALVDHARRRLRHRPRRQRRLRSPAPKWRSGSMREQEQFLHVLDRDEAERRFRAAIDLTPRGIETVPLDAALGRVLAADVVSPVDVPSFDRSNVDGFAVVAEDTFGASEEVPRSVQLGEEVIHTGSRADDRDSAGHGRVDCHRRHDAARRRCRRHGRARRDQRPRAADRQSGHAREAACRSPAPTSPAARPCCAAVSCSTSRDTGVLAAIGVAAVDVWRKPVVAILSTGDEIIAPGEPMQPAKVYDSNAQMLADAVRELGGEPMRLGIAPRRYGPPCGNELQHALEVCRCRAALGRHEQGRGRSSRIASSPSCAIPESSRTASRSSPASRSAWRRLRGRPVVVLPGFPTSAIFTFHEFVAPVIRLLAGRGVAGADRRAGAAGGQGQQRDRPHGVPAGRPGRDGGRTKRPERRSPPIRWARDPAASRRSAAPTVSRRSAGTRRSSRRARSSTCSCSAGSCSWPTSS